MTEFRLDLILTALAVVALLAAFAWRWSGRTWGAIWKWVWLLAELARFGIRRKFKKRGA